MAQILLNPFDQRQVMQGDTFELFHYNNPASFACPPHRHDFYEFYFLLDDSVSYIVDGLRYTLRAGNAILIAPGQLHRSDALGPIRNIDRFVLWMRTDYMRMLTSALPHFRYTLMGDLSGRNLIQPDEETSLMLRQLLFALHRENARDEADSAQLRRSIATQLLIYCNRCIARVPETLPHKAELRYQEVMKVYEFIITHLKDDLSVSGLAEQFFMDKNTLTRQFKRLVGMTPGDCIRRHRLEAANQMIRHGVAMQQACVECGFSDYSAFYRAFKNAYGVRPSAIAAETTQHRGEFFEERIES